MDRSTAPEIFAPNKLDLTIPKEYFLANNIKCFWIDDVKDDAVKVEMTWRAGTKYQKDALVASFTSKMLLLGTKDKSALQIASEIDVLGGYTQNEIDKDHATINLFGLKENMKNIFSLFSDAFLSADFPDEELRKEKLSGLERFKIDNEKVNVLCHRKFNQSIFGTDSLYGKVAEQTDFDSVDRSLLIEFYKSFFLGNHPVIFIVGKFDQDLLGSIQQFSTRFEKRNKDSDKVKCTQEKGITYIPKEKAIQSAIRVGRLLFDKNHRDYFNFQILNTILGGYFGSRLMANIREDKGYTYGIGSGVAVMEESAYFFISTEVGNDVRESAITEIMKELKGLREELVPDDELVRVKNYLLGDFLRQSDGPFAMMESFKNIYFHKLPITYYNDFIKAVNAVESKDLMKVAKDYLQEEDLLTVSVG